MSSGENLRGNLKIVMIVAGAAFLITISYYLSKMLSTYTAGNQSTNHRQETPAKTAEKAIKKPVKTVCQYSSLFRECHNLSHSDDCDKDSLIRALNESIKYFKRKGKKSKIRYGSTLVSTKDMIRMTADIRDGVTKWGTGAKFTEWLNKNFVFLQVRAEKFVVTGYYLPLLKGSKKKDNIFKYPLYEAPDDLIRVSLKKFDFYFKMKRQ